VRKRGGFYRQAPAAELPAPIHAVEGDAGGGIAVVRTSPAHASVVAHVIDAAQLPGVLGTVAGDDTLFVALARADAARGLRRMLGLAAQHHAEANKKQGALVELRLDKIPSATSNAALQRTGTLGRWIPAWASTVIAVRDRRRRLHALSAGAPQRRRQRRGPRQRGQLGDGECRPAHVDGQAVLEQMLDR
jgi:hypothetical protein